MLPRFILIFELSFLSHLYAQVIILTLFSTVLLPYLDFGFLIPAGYHWDPGQTSMLTHLKYLGERIEIL